MVRKQRVQQSLPLRSGRLQQLRNHFNTPVADLCNVLSPKNSSGALTDELADGVIASYWSRSGPPQKPKGVASCRPAPKSHRRNVQLKSTLPRPEPVSDQVAEVKRRMTRVPWFMDPSEQRNALLKARRVCDPFEPVRRCCSSAKVAEVHGYLSQQNIEDLVRTTNYNRRELYALFGRFKALCGLSSTPNGIDKETFRKGVPMLSVEDDLFVDRVFEVLDDDGSAIIEWEEFIEAMSALEKGSRAKRTAFLFKVYDMDKDGGISKEELYQFFLSSLMVSVDKNIEEVSGYFVEQIFAEVDVDGDGKMTVEEAYRYIEAHPEVKDIYGMFGRSMTSDQINRIEALSEKDKKTSGRRARLRDESGLHAEITSPKLASLGSFRRMKHKTAGKTLLLRRNSSKGSLVSSGSSTSLLNLQTRERRKLLTTQTEAAKKTKFSLPMASVH